jgi:hypothetical protein
MAKRFNEPIEPMDLANMRANGVRSLDDNQIARASDRPTTLEGSIRCYRQRL